MHGPVRTAACAVVPLLCLAACTKPQMRTVRHPNGARKSEGPFEDGKPTGSWTYWNQAGVKVATGSHRGGNMERTGIIGDIEVRSPQQSRKNSE